MISKSSVFKIADKPGRSSCLALVRFLAFRHQIPTVWGTREAPSCLYFRKRNSFAPNGTNTWTVRHFSWTFGENLPAVWTAVKQFGFFF